MSAKEFDTFARHLLRQPQPSVLTSPFDKKALISADFQQKAHDVIQTAGERKLPPPPYYLSRVIKHLCTLIEDTIAEEGDENDELNGNLIGLYTLYISSPKLSVRDRVPVTYKPPVFPTTSDRNLETVEVTLLEAPNLISYVGTTGHRTWEAALAIGEHMLLSTHPSYESKIPKIDVTGKIVLELGAGTGFVSILAAKMGAKKVWATDGDEGVTDTAAENIVMNEVGDVAEATVRKWGIDTNLKGSGEIDVILGADVTYDGEVIPFLVKELACWLGKFPGATVVISATIRNDTTFAVFRKECGKHKLVAEEYIWDPPEKCDRGLSNIFFYPSSTPIRFIFVKPDITEEVGLEDKLIGVELS